MPRKRSSRSRGKEREGTLHTDRRALLLGAGGLAGAVALLLVAREWQGSRREDEFRHSLSVSEPVLSQEDILIISQEGWNEEILIEVDPNFSNFSPDEQRAAMLRKMSDIMGYTVDKLARSRYAPFHNTALSFREHTAKTSLPVSGQIRLGHTVSDSGALFTADFKSTGDVWYTELALNAPMLDPNTPHEDPNFHRVVNYGLGLVHEMAHYDLTAAMIEFYRHSTTDSFSAIVNRVNTHHLQEPYAWAQTCAVVLPLLEIPNVSEPILDIFKIIASKWREFAAKGLNWDSSEWVKYANDWSSKGKLGFRPSGASLIL